MSPRYEIGMEQMSQQLHSFGESRTGPREVSIGINGIHARIEIARQRARELD